MRSRVGGSGEAGGVVHESDFPSVSGDYGRTHGNDGTALAARHMTRRNTTGYRPVLHLIIKSLETRVVVVVAAEATLGNLLCSRPDAGRPATRTTPLLSFADIRLPREQINAAGGGQALESY